MSLQNIVHVTPSPSDVPVIEGQSDGPGEHNPNFMGSIEAPPSSVDRPAQAHLDAHEDARTIIRLVQCSRCSFPLTSPLTLPCGNSLCRRCLPESHLREHITYPDIPGRQQGFVCPFTDCGKEHSLADCSADVTLAKVMDVVSAEIARYKPVTSDTPMELEEELTPARQYAPSATPQPRTRVLHGGRLVATFTFAEMGELAYDRDVTYRPIAGGSENYRHLDAAVLERLKEAARAELECQVCYHLMLDPLTTSCGHTFCRRCLNRVLDHANICPLCRRQLHMPPSLSSVPCNKRLLDLLTGLCPDLVAARTETLASEETAESGELDTPVFVCTMSFPSTPTILHIFEPRYRLMIRRAIENGTRRFGMVAYNRSGEAQGELGRTPFMQYGTLLHIVSVQMLSDGRSIIETVGVSPFKINAWGLRDGYTVANVSRVDDMSIAEEERLEAAETSLPPAAPHDVNSALDRLPTATLLELCRAYVARMRAVSAPWLHESILEMYGEAPDDAALFPYWFASVLSIFPEGDKYPLLQTRSVRERLKITARWVQRAEAQRWYVPPIV
ncbi:MAG: hypothetical protein M1825_004942 [Sarcosagium campestre]|nr:MAG: hypothetical protein M1825_004942 [Sarcosagium campestre]